MIDDCERAGVKLGVFFQDRVSDGARHLKSLIENRTLGKPVLATAHVKWYRDPEYYSKSKWRGTWSLDGGGAIMNQGIHTLDLLIWLLGNPRQVFGFTRTLLHEIETEDTAVAVIEFESGALATYEAATSAFPGQPRRIYLTGSQGTASLVHNKLADISLLGDEKKVKENGCSGKPENTSSPVVSDVSGHRRIMEDFLDAIRDNRAPMCDGKDARRSLELVCAIYESSRMGCPVTL
ncbi:MAG: Gfo/Idh/MocA family oxidoreductase [Acidobacteriota bacterium]